MKWVLSVCAALWLAGFLIGCGGSSNSAATASSGSGTGSGAGTPAGTGSGGTGAGGSGSTGSGSTGSGSATPAPVVPASHHVVMVMEENQSYETIVGNTSVWPNYNKLIQQGALPTNYYADIHGSISDYFMLTTGQIVTNDDGSTQVFNVDNIARRMLASAIPFRVYAEGITQGYVGGDLGLYVIRHEPFAMLSDVASDKTVANEVIWPFTQFATDVANDALPEYSFIVPDIDDDAHTGTPQQADTWLQTNVVNVLQKDAAFQTGGDGVLVVDFDEGTATDVAHVGGHVAPVLWGPLVKAGYQQTSATLYLHESMLRTTMELLGLANPMGTAATAPDMAEFFQQ